MKKCLRRLVWMSWAVALGGCGGMLTSDQPPEHVYWLEAANLQLGVLPTGESPDLAVTVRAMPGLDTDRILVKEPGARLNFYAGARWPDHLPEVVTAMVRVSLESSGRFNRVSSGSQTTRNDWLLELEIREFFAVAPAAGAPPQVHVRLVGSLECGLNNSAVIAAANTRAQENKLSEIIAAFQSAADKAMIDLGAQLEAHCFGQPVPGET